MPRAGKVGSDPHGQVFHVAHLPAGKDATMITVKVAEQFGHSP